MKRSATILAALLLPGLTLIGCSKSVEQSTPETKDPKSVEQSQPGTKAPEEKESAIVQMIPIRLDQLLNHRIPEHKGKVVVLDLWGTWCIHCMKEFPGLVRLHEKYGAKGVQCMSLCIPEKDGDVEDQPKALTFLGNKKAVFPNFWLKDGMAPVQKRFKFEGLPVVVVFGKDGQIARTFKRDDSQFTYDDVETVTKGLLDR